MFRLKQKHWCLEPLDPTAANVGGGGSSKTKTSGARRIVIVWRVATHELA